MEDGVIGWKLCIYKNTHRDTDKHAVLMSADTFTKSTYSILNLPI